MNENTIVQPFGTEQTGYSFGSDFLLSESPSSPPDLFSLSSAKESPILWAPPPPGDPGAKLPPGSTPVSDALPFIILLAVGYLFVCKVWSKMIPKRK